MVFSCSSPTTNHSPFEHHIFNWRSKLKHGVSVCSVPNPEWHFGPTESKELFQSSLGKIYTVRVTWVCGITCLEPLVMVKESPSHPVPAEMSICGADVPWKYCVWFNGRKHSYQLILCAKQLLFVVGGQIQEEQLAFKVGVYNFLSISFALFFKKLYVIQC